MTTPENNAGQAVRSSSLLDHASGLLAKSKDNDLPITIEGGREMFGFEADSTILVMGAITTPERFARFNGSLAHLMDDGRIMRNGRQIGDALLISERSNAALKSDDDVGVS